MGNCCKASEVSSPVGNQARAKSDENRIKFLFLGAGESGKTTLFKQIKINYTQNYSNATLEGERDRIIYSILMHFSDFTAALNRTGGVSPDLKIQEQSDIWFPLVPPDDNETPPRKFTPEILIFMKTVWNSERGRDLWANHSSFPITDSLEYFMDNLDRISEPKYVPSETDYLKCRITTAGATEQTFLYRGITIFVVDIGGQRSERNKWVNCFVNVSAVLFVVSVSDFDQVLYEKEKDRRLPDAIDLFQHTVNSYFFETTPFVLFLNKQDLLKEKLEIMKAKNQNLDEYFPELGLGTNYHKVYPKIQDHVQDLFMRQVPEKKLSHVFPHRIIAIDKGNFKHIFKAATQIVLTEALEEAGHV